LLTGRLNCRPAVPLPKPAPGLPFATAVPEQAGLLKIAIDVPGSVVPWISGLLKFDGGTGVNERPVGVAGALAAVSRFIWNGRTTPSSKVPSIAWPSAATVPLAVPL